VEQDSAASANKISRISKDSSQRRVVVSLALLNSQQLQQALVVSVALQAFNSIPLRRAYSPSLLSQASADSPLRSALLLKQEDSLDSPPSSSSSQLSLQADSLLVRVQILLPVHSDSKLKQSRPALVDSGRVQVRHLLLEMALVDLEHRNSLLLLPLAVVRQPLAPSQLEVSSVSQQRRHLDNRNNRLVDCLESLR
jgi:hypothetical protein